MLEKEQTIETLNKPLKQDYEGSFILGFILGYFLNIFCLLLAIFIKQKRTKKALIITSIVTFIMLVIFSILIVDTMIKAYGGSGLWETINN